MRKSLLISLAIVSILMTGGVGSLFWFGWIMKSLSITTEQMSIQTEYENIGIDDMKKVDTEVNIKV